MPFGTLRIAKLGAYCEKTNLYITNLSLYSGVLCSKEGSNRNVCIRKSKSGEKSMENIGRRL